MEDYGVSLSVKQCRNFNISPIACLEWLIKECGFKRFRLMSYWDEIQPVDGKYNFQALDKQIEIIKKNKGTVSLCLGARQPRWPENHWPPWVWQLSQSERTQALLNFLEVVVKRYQDNKCIVSYQLENEALLKSFGTRPEIDRNRLKLEFDLVKRIDASKPIIMTTSTSWGIPIRRPIGDIVGFSYYQLLYNTRRNAYTTAFHKVWLSKLKAFLVRALWRRQSFIHEIQLEPWGPKNIWEMTFKEQMKSMNPNQIKLNIELAQKTNLKPIDLWGGEWWYWCNKKQGNKTIINAVLQAINK